MMGIRSTGPKDFPRIAKEMGFNFSLRRGRVDWHKIGGIDIDRLVQERDLVSLQENLISVINYNLDNEYDVKILDSNFVKLFKLAQLSIDYLMYSEQHLYNCIELEQTQLKKYLKEVDRLKRECKKKDDEIKNLKKRLKDTHGNAADPRRHQHFKTGSGDALTTFFKCTHCGKTFLTAAYLEGHHERRHPGLPFSPPPTPDPFRTETERLQSEIKELKERLNSTEKFLQRDSTQDMRERRSQTEEGDITNWNEEQKRRMAEWQEAQRHKYLEEIAGIKAIFFNELKRLKESAQASAEPAATASHAALLAQIHKQDEELVALRESLSRQSTPDLENVQGRLEAQERFWKSKLKQIEMGHIKELEELKTRVEEARESESNSRLTEYEGKISQLMVRAAKQDEILKAQAEQIHNLSKTCITENRTTQTDNIEQASVTRNKPMLRTRSDEKIQADAAATFADLAARIDNAIDATKHSPERPNSADTNLNIQSLSGSENTPRPSANTTKPPSQTSKQSRSRTTVKTQSSTVDSESVQSSKQITTDKPTIETSISKKLTETPKSMVPQEETSSDSSPQTEDIADDATSMYGLVSQNQTVRLHGSQSPEKAWNTESPKSLQGSKDSGLDSPQRFSTSHIAAVTKISAFQRPFADKTKSVINLSEDRVDKVEDVVESEDNDEDEEDEEVEEEETLSEETAEETETETDSASDLQVRSIHSLKDALKQNPHILTELKKDLQDLLARRLRELGVDPEWKGIPKATFRQNMATLKHHQNITAKRYESFVKIRQKILDEVDRRLSRGKNGGQQDGSKDKERKTAARTVQQNKLAVKNLVGKVKTKALSVLKRSTGTDVKGRLSAQSAVLAIRPVSGKQTKQPQQDSDGHKVKRQYTGSSSKGPELNKKNVAGNKLKTRKPHMKQRTKSAVKTMNIGSAKQDTALTPKVTIVTSTPYKNPAPVTGASPRGGILKGSSMPEPTKNKQTIKTPSVSSLEDEEEEDVDEDDEEEDDLSEVDIGDSARKPPTSLGQQTLSSQTVKDSRLPQPTIDNKSSSSSVLNQTAITKKWDVSQDNRRDQDSPKGSKSALKASSTSSSLGSITKKRVLFVDQEQDAELHRTGSLPKPWNVSKAVDASRLARSTETLAVKSSSSWDSSLGKSPAKSVTFASNVTSQLGSNSSDSESDDSDWGLSSGQDNIDKVLHDTEDVQSGSYERINLRTKQSPKIAQISKDLEKQLTMARSKPPTGGVEVLFHAGGSTAAEKSSQQEGTNSSFDSSTSLGSNVSDNRKTTTVVPTPKPRSHLSTTATQDTSKKFWNLDDFDSD